MHQLAEFFERLVDIIRPWAEQLGGPGLAVVAFLDSSFVSLPEVNDALIVLLVIQHPARWFYYAACTTLGSVAGCYALYLVGRKGGEAFLQKRFSKRNLERGLTLFRRHGLLAVVIPSILPPPMPFKIFVLLSGVAKVRTPTFLLAVFVGRGFRYGVEAWLAYLYGPQAMSFIRENLPVISLVFAAVVAAGGIALVVWRKRARAT